MRWLCFCYVVPESPLLSCPEHLDTLDTGKGNDCFISVISFNFHINQKGEHSYVTGLTLEEAEAQRS